MTTGRVALACVVAAGVLLASACAQRPDADDQKKAPTGEAAPAAPASGVTLSAEALALSAVRVAALQAATHVPMRQAFGQVVDTAPLFQAAATVAARRGELETARASLAATSAELERVRALHDQGENASLRSLEAAQAAQRSDEVRVAASQAQLSSGWSELRQSWGPVITGWLQEGSPELQELADSSQRLVLVTLTGGDAAVAAPAEVAVTAGGRTLPARLVSPAPRTDPALQGPSLFYRVADGGGALFAGLNVAVAVPDGEARAGVLVPEGAVVRWSGVRWVYRQSGAGHFERVAVGEADPVAGGLFVATGLAAGDQVAVAGAAVLLSQELTDLGIAAPASGD
jgi:hypothetical protein